MESRVRTETVRAGDPLGQWQCGPAEWHEYTLWELAEYINGRAFKPVDFSESGLQVIRITDLKYGISKGTARFGGSFEDRHLLRKDDLLFAWSGNPETSLDAFRWGSGPALLNQHIFRVIPRPVVDRDYLYFLLKFLRPTFIRTARDKATSMGHVKVTDLKRLIVKIPPVQEQLLIAHILRTLDDKIELNRRMNETLEAMARAIFKSWFVDFDPVHRNAAQRRNQPSPAASRHPLPMGEGWDEGAVESLDRLFPDSFEDSELGQVPSGWKVRRWGDLVTLEYGKSLSGYANSKGAYPVFGTNGRIGSHSEALCDHPGIIIGRKGAYRGVHFCSSPFFVIDTAFYVEPMVGLEMRWAYYELLRQDINNMDSGSAIPSTSREDFYSLPVLTPPIEIQKRFVEMMRPCWARQEKNDRESRTLAALRDTLLLKLVSGELRVKDAERFLEDTKRC